MKLSLVPAISSLFFLISLGVPAANAETWTGTQVVKYSANFSEAQLDTALFYAKKQEVIRFMRKRYSKRTFSLDKMSRTGAVLSLMDSKKRIIGKVFITDIEATLVSDPEERHKVVITRPRKSRYDCDENLREVEQEYEGLFDVEHVSHSYDRPCKFWIIRKIAEVTFDFRTKKVSSASDGD